VRQSSKFKVALGYFFSLIKLSQTSLLVITGIAGAVSVGWQYVSWQIILSLTGSLFLAVSGCTILNMVYDRDIDLLMSRTAKRPIPSGEVTPTFGYIFGGLLTITGVLWAFWMQSAYGWVVAAGVFFDVVVYTMWLRRRTPYSVVLGGLSGGMPILAGRVLTTGRVDLEGLVMAVAILVWIPIHTLTLHLKFQSDFDRAGIPTFSGKFGIAPAQILIAISAGLSAIGMVLAGYLIHLGIIYLVILALCGLGLIIVLILSLIHKDNIHAKLLFRSASIFMLVSMILLIAGK
jgi:protoheme IX farnesyltransferase